MYTRVLGEIIATSLQCFLEKVYINEPLGGNHKVLLKNDTILVVGSKWRNIWKVPIGMPRFSDNERQSETINEI